MGQAPGIPYASTPMHKTNLQLIESYRLRTAKLNAYKFITKAESTVNLACPFCRIHGNTIIEDTYHTCLECPLYQIPRQRLLESLAQAVQKGKPEDYAELTSSASAYTLLARILTPINQTETWATIRYLKDSRALRKLAMNEAAGDKTILQRHHDDFDATLQTVAPLQTDQLRIAHPLLAARLPALSYMADLLNATAPAAPHGHNEPPGIPADPSPANPPQGIPANAANPPPPRARRKPGKIIQYL